MLSQFPQYEATESTLLLLFFCFSLYFTESIATPQTTPHPSPTLGREIGQLRVAPYGMSPVPIYTSGTSCLMGG